MVDWQAISAENNAYPPALIAHGVQVPFITICGQWPLTTRPAIALFSATKAPGGVILQAHDLAQQWRQQAITLISGFQSPVEEEVWTVLWRDVVNQTGAPLLVKVLARGMLQRFSPQEKAALAAGRLTIVSPFAEGVRRATRETAMERNRVAAALAETVLIAHAHEGSATWQLTHETLAWGKRVVTLNHPANAALLALGAKSLESATGR